MVQQQNPIENFTGVLQYANEAQPGKKKGSIKFEDGSYVSVWPRELDQFRNSLGRQLTIPVEISTAPEGRKFMHFHPGQQQGSGRQQGNGAGNGQAMVSRLNSAPSHTPNSGSADPGGPGGSARALIAAACIKAGLSMQEATAWYEWAQSGKAPAPAPAPAPAAPATNEIPWASADTTLPQQDPQDPMNYDTQGPMDDEIPF